MKVLLVNQAFYPDVVATAQHTYDLAQFLTSKGCRVSVVCSNRGYDRRDQVFPLRESHRGIEIYRVRSTGLAKTKFIFRVLDSITFEFMLFWKLLTVPKADIMIGFTSPPLIGFIGVIVGALRRTRYLNWLMDLNPDAAIAVGYIREGSLAARVLRKAFQFSLKYAAHSLVLDRWMMARIQAYGIAPEKIAVIRPWAIHEIDSEKHKVPSQNWYRKQHGLVDKFIILYSGNHSVVHPLVTLLEAAKSLKDDPTIHFVFVGGGLRVDEVTEFKRVNGLANILQLPHQPRERLDESLGMANLHVVVMGESVNGLVHTSKVYGILATGTPYVAIAPLKSHLGDLLSECPYGFQVEHGETAKLIGVIHQVQMMSPAQLKEYSQHNTAWVKTNGAPKKLMDEFYTSVLIPLAH